MDLTQIVAQMRGNTHVVHEFFTNQRESQEAHAKLMSAYNAVSGSPYFKPLLMLLGQVVDSQQETSRVFEPVRLPAFIFESEVLLQADQTLGGKVFPLLLSGTNSVALERVLAVGDFTPLSMTGLLGTQLGDALPVQSRPQSFFEDAPSTPPGTMRRIIPEAPAHKPRVSMVGGPTGGMPQHSYSHVFQREMVTPTLQQQQQQQQTSTDVDTHAISIARPVPIPSRIKQIYEMYLFFLQEIDNVRGFLRQELAYEYDGPTSPAKARIQLPGNQNVCVRDCVLCERVCRHSYTYTHTHAYNAGESLLHHLSIQSSILSLKQLVQSAFSSIQYQSTVQQAASGLHGLQSTPSTSPRTPQTSSSPYSAMDMAPPASKSRKPPMPRVKKGKQASLKRQKRPRPARKETKSAPRKQQPVRQAAAPRPTSPRRGGFDTQATECLHNWLLSHFTHPYPSEQQKADLAHQSGLTLQQINYFW
jgi:hypothetical protein